jgi:hypothetical protein
MPQQATLYNPDTGDRQAVDVGSSNAQELFGNNYVLEESYDQTTGVSTYAGMNAQEIESNVPPEGETINPDESTEQATGGYRDTFAEDALAALNGDQAALNQFRIQTIENQRLENESRMTELQLQSDADAKSINTWTNDNTDKRVEDFKEEIDYQDTVDKLNAIEMESADAWKNYTDLKHRESQRYNAAPLPLALFSLYVPF